MLRYQNEKKIRLENIRYKENSEGYFAKRNRNYEKGIPPFWEVFEVKPR
jgi:hypothetical protein